MEEEQENSTVELNYILTDNKGMPDRSTHKTQKKLNIIKWAERNYEIMETWKNDINHIWKWDNSSVILRNKRICRYESIAGKAQKRIRSLKIST